jgi:esterase/lipase
MRKKLLYLHGYQGAPNLEKVAYMESLGFDVIAPHIDYDNRPDIISELSELDFDYIIGNSLGSYVGFYLSEIKGVPSVLINAPMYMNIMEVINCQINVPHNLLNLNCGVHKKHIILGADDDIVNPVKVVEWLGHSGFEYDVHMYKGMGHVYTHGQFVDSVQPILFEFIVSDSHNIYKTT